MNNTKDKRILFYLSFPATRHGPSDSHFYRHYRIVGYNLFLYCVDTG